MTIAHHNERDGWTWYTDPAGRILVCGSDAAAVRGAVRGAGYQLESEPVLPAERHCGTCDLGGAVNATACKSCMPPDWPAWRAKA